MGIGRLKPGFHMSGKSQTIGDFSPDCPRFCRLMKTRNRRYPWSSGMDRDKSGESGRARFYFPDASQISAMVGDHSRQMKTQICTVGDVGDGFSSLRTLSVVGLQSPFHTFVYKFQFLARFPFPAKYNFERIWDRLLEIILYIGKIVEGRQKVKSLIAWDFPDIWKPGLILWSGGRGRL